MTHYYRRAVRLRGKPWPEASSGLVPMFGEGGWCVSCGTEHDEQTGPLTLQARSMKVVDGAWVPSWQINVLCLSAAVGAEAVERFGLVTRPVAWRPEAEPADPARAAVQVVLPLSDEPFYDADELSAATTARHGSAGKDCPECGRWKWYPLFSEQLPPVRLALDPEAPIVASPERFGDGGISAREIVFSAAFVDFLHERSPRDFQSRDKEVEATIVPERPTAVRTPEPRFEQEALPPGPYRPKKTAARSTTRATESVPPKPAVPVDRPTDPVEAFFQGWDGSRYRLFAQGKELSEQELAPLISAVEREVGFELPADFREFCASPLGGLQLVARQDLWPAPELYDVGPAWRHEHGLSVYGLTADAPEWLSLPVQRAELVERFPDRTDLVPFMARTVASSVFCFAPGGRIVEVSLTGDGDSDDGGEVEVESEFSDLLLSELKALDERLDRVVAERSADDA